MKLKSIIKDFNLENHIKIISNISDEELLKIYNNSDLFVLPSIVDSQGNTEGLGVVLLEAMACKLPVIASNIGGIPDIIDDGNTGMLVPQKDIFQLSSTINNLIKNESLREKIAIEGYYSVQNKFSWKRIAECYLKIYEQYNK